LMEKSTLFYAVGYGGGQGLGSGNRRRHSKCCGTSAFLVPALAVTAPTRHKLVRSSVCIDFPWSMFNIVG
jgi:hypothetical protein